MIANLSPHFTIAEMVKSDTAFRLGINNQPTDDIIYRLAFGCHNILEPLRRLAGHPIIITSGYRCRLLNKAVGGVSNSQHVLGCAADVRVSSAEDGELLFSILRKINYVDQALYEKSGTTKWLHVSWSLKPRLYYNDNYRV